jgi:hypothetical protein
MAEIEQDPFIGQRFGDGGHLEVIGWDGQKSGNVKKYKVLCHICAQDSEMFGDGVFYILAAHLRKGVKPCGCSKNPRFTKEQYLTRVRRECEANNCSLVDVSSEWRNVHTKVKIRCSKGLHEWWISISNFCQGKGCPGCARDKILQVTTKSEAECTSVFLKSGMFLPGTRFTRSPRVDSKGWRSWWYVYCPVCSEDEEVKAGRCSGLFETFHSSLNGGRRPCRCPSQTRKSSELNNIYVLRVSGNREFTGYGVSRCVERRITTHRKNLLRTGCYINEIEIFSTTGKIAYIVENMIKNNFNLLSQNVEGFKTEATSYHFYDDVVSFVDSEISKLEGNMCTTQEPCFDNDSTRPEVDEKILEELGHNLLKDYERGDD